MRPDVALVTTSYPSSSEDAAGRPVLGDAMAWAENGKRAVVVLRPAARSDPAPRSPFDAPFSPAASPPVVHLPHGDAFGWPGAWARLRAGPWRGVGVRRFGLAVAHHLRRMRPRRIRAHWLLPSGWWCASAAETCGAALDVVGHGSDVRLFARLPAPLRHRLARRLVRCGAHLQFVAPSLRDDFAAALPEVLRRPLLRDSEIRACPLPPLAPQTPRMKLPPRYVAVVGRRIPSKRIPLALHAGRRAGLPCVVVGAGPVPVPPGRAVWPVGRQPHGVTLGILAAARALLHPSAAEGAPTVIREARALGVPVVACDAGDIAARAASDPGIRVVAPCPHALARALRDIDARASMPADGKSVAMALHP